MSEKEAEPLSEEKVEQTIKTLVKDAYEYYEQSITCKNDEEASDLIGGAQANFSLAFFFAATLNEDRQRAVLDCVILDYIERAKALTPACRMIKLPTSSTIVNLARLGLSDEVFVELLNVMKEIDANAHQKLLNLMMSEAHKK